MENMVTQLLIMMALLVGAIIYIIKIILPKRIKDMQAIVENNGREERDGYRETRPYLSSTVIAKMIKEAVATLTENDLAHVQDDIAKILNGCSRCGQEIARLDERVKTLEKNTDVLFDRLKSR